MSEIPTSANIRVPEWLWGGAPAAFFESARLRAREERESGVWIVRTEEQHLRQISPGLVETHSIAGPRQAQPLFDRTAGFAGPQIRGPVSEGELEALRVRAERAIASKQLVDAFNLYTLQTMVADQAELPAMTKHVYDELKSFQMEDSGDAVFPHASVHVVWRREELVRRIKMTGVLVRLEHDAQLAAGDLSGVQSAVAAKKLVFASSESLLQGATFLDPYFGPLLGALSPGVWGFHAAREIGLVLYGLGRPISGAGGDAVEPLQLLPMLGPDKAVKFPEIGSEACSEAIDWWTTQLDRLFGVLTNPAVFTDRQQNYVPVKHIQAVGSAEQLFRRVTALQAAHRDKSAQRVLFFSSLDTLERLGSRDIQSYCTLRIAEATLERLRNEIPSAAARLLLPPAERAVSALRELQDGFYFARQLDLPEIDVLNNGTVVDRMTLENAAAMYVKVLRNATHGFGTKKADRIAYANALLAHHDGHLPHDLVLLAYMYLLDVLTRPDVLARKLYQQGRVS